MSSKTKSNQRNKSKSELLKYITKYSQDNHCCIALLFLSHQKSHCYSSSHIIQQHDSEDILTLRTVSSSDLLIFLHEITKYDQISELSFMEQRNLFTRILKYVTKHTTIVFLSLLAQQTVLTVKLSFNPPSFIFIDLNTFIQECEQSTISSVDLTYKKTRDQHQPINQSNHRITELEKERTELIQTINQLREQISISNSFFKTPELLGNHQFHPLLFSELNLSKLNTRKPASEKVVSYFCQQLCAESNVAFVNSEAFDSLNLYFLHFLQKYGNTLHSIFHESPVIFLCHLGVLPSSNNNEYIGHFILIVLEHVIINEKQGIHISIIDSLKQVDKNIEKILLGPIISLLRYWKIPTVDPIIITQYPPCAKQAVASEYCGWFVIWNLHMFLRKLSPPKATLAINHLETKLIEILTPFMSITPREEFESMSGSREDETEEDMCSEDEEGCITIE
ncbi:hypothetical protein RCL1_005415 [Eukaryota sp. TZLM3-RCL]